MTAITAGTPTDTRTAAPRWRQAAARATLARAARAVASAARAVRTRHASPLLTAAGLGSIDIAAWETFGRGAAWAALGASVLVYDWQRDK